MNKLTDQRSDALWLLVVLSAFGVGLCCGLAVAAIWGMYA